MATLFQFVMRSGPTPGVTFPLSGDQLIVGRDAVNAVSINDAEVSRKHARLTFQGGKYVIEDLGSTNGTFVNGVRITTSTVLKSGDIVSLGEQIVLMYEGLSADAGATVLGRKAVHPAPSPAPAAAPAPQAYPPPAPAAPAASRPLKNLPIFIGIGVLLLVCVCAAALWYIDSNYMWCTFFPFLSGCG